MPIYQYLCLRCGATYEAYRTLEERTEPMLCGVVERVGSRGGILCSGPLAQTLSTGISGRVGMKGRSHYIHSNGLIELGDEPPEKVQKYFAEKRSEREASEQQTLYKAAEGVVTELGENLYTHG